MRHQVDPRASALQLTLLASLGLLPIACGGATSGHTSGIGGSNGTGGFPGATAGSSPGKPGQTRDGVACTNPIADPVSGLVGCDEGYTHRPVAKTCGENLTGVGQSASEQRTLPRLEEYVPCGDDPRVCEQYRFGYCEQILGSPACLPGCADDTDCNDGSICLCRADGLYGECELGACQADADCEPGFSCASYVGGCGGGYACQTAKDTCISSADCNTSEGCQPGDDGVRVCTPPCLVGRPFLVAAEARVAPVIASGAWRGRARTPQVDHLSSDERDERAAHWARLGQLEHASIAAFARFGLQLLALGAPPELVEACTRALGDETAHTRLCFELASAYAGRTLGPGPLEIADCLAAVSLDEVLRLVIEEGCFGETGGALEAQRAADEASDPVIQAAYAQIARDETRHAELAFRFVGWALKQDYPTTRQRVLAALAQQGPSDAIANVAAPCLEALLCANQAA